MSFMYLSGKRELLNLLLNNTIEVILVNDQFNEDEGLDYNSILSYEVTGTGYSRKQLANKQIIDNPVESRCELHADNLSWAGLDCGTIKGAVFTFNNIPFMYRNDGEFPYNTNGSDFTLRFKDGKVFVL